MLTINLCSDGKYRITRRGPSRDGKPPADEVIGEPFWSPREARSAAVGLTHPGERVQARLGRLKAPPAPKAPKKEVVAVVGESLVPASVAREWGELTAKDAIAAAKEATGDIPRLVDLGAAERLAHPPKTKTDAPGRKSVMTVINRLLKAATK